MNLRPFVLMPALALALPRLASAQLALEAQASVQSAFVWRGLTIVNRPVVQPEAVLSVGPASLGLWANLEPVRYHGARDLTALAGRPAPGFTEFDPSFQLGHTVGSTTLAAGAIAYLFTHAAGHETLPNTIEAYGRVELPGKLPLELAGYYDLHAVRGVYLEAGVDRPLPGWAPLLVGARVGASFGESAGPESAYFERDGLTHVQLSAALPFVAGPFRVTPRVDGAYGFDGATRVTALGRTHRAKLWVGASVAWPAGED